MDAGAVVDGIEMVVSYGGDALYGGNEPDVDQHLMAGLGHLVAFPSLHVALIGQQPAHAKSLSHPPHPQRRYFDTAEALEAHGDLQRAEEVVVAQ